MEMIYIKEVVKRDDEDTSMSVALSKLKRVFHISWNHKEIMGEKGGHELKSDTSFSLSWSSSVTEM